MVWVVCKAARVNIWLRSKPRTWVSKPEEELALVGVHFQAVDEFAQGAL